MGRKRLKGVANTGEGLFPKSGIGFLWYPQDESDLFASFVEMGMGIGISPNSNDNGMKLPQTNGGFLPEILVVGEEGLMVKKKMSLRLKVKVSNPCLRRLISGAIAGAISRTAVAPLETIRTHLMVGSCGHSTAQVFHNIMNEEGWKGLFRGNLVNVLRVAPSKAIERGVYKNVLDAFVKIAREEGAAELYRGLTPSLIGVIPYAATNYFAYDTLRKAYKRVFMEEEIGNLATLLIGSAAGEISSSATFPLEVARKHMQAGALNGRQYQNMLHALATILEHEGVTGLYRGLRPSCLKLVPAAGISFMCYEACKKILVENENGGLRTCTS